MTRLRRTVPATPLPYLVCLPGGQHAVRLPRPGGHELELPSRTPAYDLDAAELAELGWRLAYVRGEV